MPNIFEQPVTFDTEQYPECVVKETIDLTCHKESSVIENVPNATHNLLIHTKPNGVETTVSFPYPTQRSAEIAHELLMVRLEKISK